MMALRRNVILRRPRSGRLEGRTDVGPRRNTPLTGPGDCNCGWFLRNIPTEQRGERRMARPRALENIRVVDFTWVRAGPWATRWLGAFGAEDHQDRMAGERARPAAEHHHAAAPRSQPEHLGQFQRHQRQQEEPQPQRAQPEGAGDRQAADRRLRHRDREFQLARAAQLGPRLRRAARDQARHRLCVDVGLRPYRAASPLHDLRPGRAGGRRG